MFEKVKESHIEKACWKVLRNGFNPKRAGRSTFVEFEGNLLPAKYVLGLAYEFAEGVPLDPEEFTGGKASAKIIENKTKMFKIVNSNKFASGEKGRTAKQKTAKKSSTGEIGLLAKCIRVATVNVGGAPVKSTKENKSRIDMLLQVVKEIEQRRVFPDIILFPGGFFYLPYDIGPLDQKSRIRKFANEDFSKACISACKNSGKIIVAGVDNKTGFRPGYAPDEDEVGNQLCVAWNHKEIIGLGRKVFPAGDEADGLIVYAEDLSSQFRLSPFNNVNKGLLCSCYDMFGCTESGKAPGARSRNIKWLYYGKNELHERSSVGSSVRGEIINRLSDWEDLVKQADVGLAAIHCFTRTRTGSGKGYWHRHGVVKASTVLGGRKAFGACHYEKPLPKPDVDSVFSAVDGERLAPENEFYILSRKGIPALVRLFRA